MADVRVEDQVKAVIVDRLMLKAQPGDIGDDDDLIKKWEVESVQLMEIVIALEEQFSIHLEEEEFSIKQFRTVKNIAGVVREKTRAS
jgi:acyl carrier protein